MANKKDVKFIRRNGRIIPIRSKGTSAPKKKTESRKVSAAKAVGAAGAGVVSAAFAGSAFAEFGKEAEFRRSAAKGLFKRGQGIKAQAKAVAAGSKMPGHSVKFLLNQAKTFTRAGAFQRVRARSIGKTGFIVGAASLFGGTFLLNYGARKGGEAAKADGNLLFETAATLPLAVAGFEYGKKRGLGRSAAMTAINAIMKRRRL